MRCSIFYLNPRAFNLSSGRRRVTTGDEAQAMAAILRKHRSNSSQTPVCSVVRNLCLLDSASSGKHFRKRMEAAFAITVPYLEGRHADSLLMTGCGTGETPFPSMWIQIYMTARHFHTGTWFLLDIWPWLSAQTTLRVMIIVVVIVCIYVYMYERTYVFYGVIEKFAIYAIQPIMLTRRIHKTKKKVNST